MLQDALDVLEIAVRRELASHRSRQPHDRRDNRQNVVFKRDASFANLVEFGEDEFHLRSWHPPDHRNNHRNAIFKR